MLDDSSRVSDWLNDGTGVSDWLDDGIHVNMVWVCVETKLQIRILESVSAL